MSNDRIDSVDLAPWLLAKIDVKLRGLVSAVLMVGALLLCVGKVVSETGSLRPLVPVSVLTFVIIAGYWVMRGGSLGAPGPDEKQRGSAKAEPAPLAATSADPWADFEAKQDALRAEMEAKAPRR